MGNNPQLFMRKPRLDDLPSISQKIGPLPDGISLHTHVNGMEKAWEDLIERSFGQRFAFDSNMSSTVGFHPTQVFYLAKDGVDVAVAAAVEMPTYPGEGWLHFVGIDPAARGLGLSHHIVLATLYSFWAQGYKSVVLSTDDFRIPAIKSYLKLGFEPIMLDETHPERWEKVLAEIKK